MYRFLRKRILLYENAVLIQAITANDAEAVFRSLNRGADPNARDLSLCRPWCLQACHFLKNRLLGRAINEEKAVRKTTLQVLFAYRILPDGRLCGYPENLHILQALLDRGADPNVWDEHGENPLDCACLLKSPDCVRLLLDYGSKVNVTDRLGGTPLLSAVCNCAEIVLMLLNAGADPNTQTHEGRTPLHQAVIMDNGEAVRLLLAARAEVNTQDNFGETALHHVAFQHPSVIMKNRLEIARLLLEHGADMYVEDKNGNTPLTFALAGDNNALIAVFKQHGAK